MPLLTTQTKYGTAEYALDEAGDIRVRWPNGANVNGVSFRVLSAYTDDRHAEVYGDGLNVNAEACELVKAEARRLRDLHNTPQARARARVEACQREHARATQTLETWQAEERRTRDLLHAAQSALAALELT